METGFRRFFCVAGTVLMICQSAGQVALADETGGGDQNGAAHHCHQHNADNSQHCANASINLDMSSATASVAFQGGHQAASLNIDVAGVAQTVNPGQMLTPAQAVAAYQVMHGGVQNILLGADGSAVGGSMVIGSRLANILNSIVIPTGVTVIDRAANLNLAGNLTNAGNILAVSNNSAVTTAAISANNILNSGLLSTVLPSSILPSSIPGLDLSQYGSILNLSLNAINNIVNTGTISSSGSLTATAGGSIQNLLSGPGAVAPVMQAMNALNIQAPQVVNHGQIMSQLANINMATNALTNSGLIQALSGSINIAGLTSNVLNVNNIAGQIIARDAIAMTTMPTLFNEDGSVLKKAGIDLSGGVLTASELKFTSPDGVIKLDSDRLNGAVHIDGGIAEVHVKGGDLNIASLNLSGDPIFTNSNGNVAISNFNASGTASDFIVLATGNITANPGTTSIVTSGGNIVMSAGYLFTGSDSNCTDCTGLYTISRVQSSTGGSINLTGVSLSAAGNNGATGIAGGAGGQGSTGGSVTLQAPGAITVASISAMGGTGGSGGIGVGAGGPGGNGGNSGAGGNIWLYSGSTITLSSTVSAASGQGGTGGTGAPDATAGGSGGNGGASRNGGNIDISAVSDISILSLSASALAGGTGGVGGSSTTNGGAGGNGSNAGNGGNITVVSSSGSISATSTITAAGGAGGVGGFGGTGNSGAGGAAGNGGGSGNGGVILFNAGGSITNSGTVTVAGGKGGNGGAGGNTSSGFGGAGGNGGDGGNAGMATFIAGSTIGVNNTFNAASGFGGTGGNGGTGAIAGVNGLNGSSGLAYGVLLLEAGATSNAINIGSSSQFASGSLGFITGYGTLSPVFTKVLPTGTAFTIFNTDLSGSGITAANGASFLIFNDVQIAQNSTADLLVNNITSNGGALYTASNGNISSTAGSSLVNTAVSRQDVIAISSFGVTEDNGQPGGTIDVSNNNGDLPGGQIIMVANTSTGFVSAGAIVNPFMILSSTVNPSSAINLSLPAISLNTNSNLVYLGSYRAVNLQGGASVTTSGITPAVAGANGLPGGQIIMYGRSSLQLSDITANGADGANGGTGGSGGAGGIINFITDVTNIAGLVSSTGSINALGGAGGSGGAGGLGGNGGDIKIVVKQIRVLDSINAYSSATGEKGNGGNIYINTATASDLTIGNSFGSSNYIGGSLDADSLVSGVGGTVTVITAGGINIDGGAVVARGGDIGGSITLQSAGNMTINTGGVTGIETSANNAGGSIVLQSGGTLDVIGSSIIRADSFAIGGAVTLKALSDITLSSNLPIYAYADTYGGRIDILSDGIITINQDLNANGTSGAPETVGGKIQISSYTPGAAPVTLINNATITASSANDDGIVGINGGTNAITITGSGTLTGGQYVNIGNLDSSTLAIASPFTVVSSFSGVYTEGNISITQGAINGTLQVSSAAAPAPTPSTPATTVTPAAPVLFNLQLYLLYLALLQQLQNTQTTNLNEQLGTRIATDYTPYTTYPYQPNFELPLQGNITVEQLAKVGEALFTATSFNANELNVLSQNGIDFGPNSGGNFLQLNKGYVLFMPTSDIKVQTKEGVVSIPKGAVAWVMETGNDAAVYDMHDSKGAPVKVVVNGKELTLAPGMQILLTRDGKSNFDALNPGGNIGTRNVHEKDMGAGIKAYFADFTISGGMANVNVMRNLLKSNNPEHQVAAHKMLKNAAILSDLGGYKTPYKTKR